MRLTERSWIQNFQKSQNKRAKTGANRTCLILHDHYQKSDSSFAQNGKAFRPDPFLISKQMKSLFGSAFKSFHIKTSSVKQKYIYIKHPQNPKVYVRFDKWAGMNGQREGVQEL